MGVRRRERVIGAHVLRRGYLSPNRNNVKECRLQRAGGRASQADETATPKALRWDGASVAAPRGWQAVRAGGTLEAEAALCYVVKMWSEQPDLRLKGSNGPGGQAPGWPEGGRSSGWQERLSLQETWFPTNYVFLSKKTDSWGLPWWRSG